MGYPFSSDDPRPDRDNGFSGDPSDSDIYQEEKLTEFDDLVLEQAFAEFYKESKKPLKASPPIPERPSEKKAGNWEGTLSRCFEVIPKKLADFWMPDSVPKAKAKAEAKAEAKFRARAHEEAQTQAQTQVQAQVQAQTQTQQPQTQTGSTKSKNIKNIHVEGSNLFEFNGSSYTEFERFDGVYRFYDGKLYLKKQNQNDLERNVNETFQGAQARCSRSPSEASSNGVTPVPTWLFTSATPTTISTTESKREVNSDRSCCDEKQTGPVTVIHDWHEAPDNKFTNPTGAYNPVDDEDFDSSDDERTRCSQPAKTEGTIKSVPSFFKKFRRSRHVVSKGKYCTAENLRKQDNNNVRPVYETFEDTEAEDTIVEVSKAEVSTIEEPRVEETKAEHHKVEEPKVEGTKVKETKTQYRLAEVDEMPYPLCATYSYYLESGELPEFEDPYSHIEDTSIEYRFGSVNLKTYGECDDQDRGEFRFVDNAMERRVPETREVEVKVYRGSGLSEKFFNHEEDSSSGKSENPLPTIQPSEPSEPTQGSEASEVSEPAQPIVPNEFTQPSETNEPIDISEATELILEAPKRRFGFHRHVHKKRTSSKEKFKRSIDGIFGRVRSGVSSKPKATIVSETPQISSIENSAFLSYAEVTSFETLAFNRNYQ